MTKNVKRVEGWLGLSWQKDIHQARLSFKAEMGEELEGSEDEDMGGNLVDYRLINERSLRWMKNHFKGNLEGYHVGRLTRLRPIAECTGN
jgi:hypothetical protein